MMGGLPPRRSDEEKALRTAEAVLEGAAERAQQGTVLGALGRVREYAEDVFIETPPADDDLKVLVGAFDNALGFIDQTVYANEDSSPTVAWRNDEVLSLLADIRRALVGGEVGKDA